MKKKSWSRRRFMNAALQGVATMGASGAGAMASSPAAPVVGGLSPAHRATLLAAMDEIIPAAPAMPSASQAGCLEYLEDTARRDGAFRDELVQAIEAVRVSGRAGFGHDFAELEANERVAALRELESGSPSGAFRVLRDAVYEAYYTRPEVGKRLGFEFYPPARPGPLPPPFDDSVLRSQRGKKPLYREVG